MREEIATHGEGNMYPRWFRQVSTQQTGKALPKSARRLTEKLGSDRRTR